MRALLLALMLVLANPVLAQTGGTAGANLALKFVADEATELSLPVDPNKPIRVTLGNEEIFYNASSFQCGQVITHRLLKPVTRPPQLDLFALKAGICHVSIQTSIRRYNLWLTVKSGAASVASIRWL